MKNLSVAQGDAARIASLIKGMREAYARGQNVMAYARKTLEGMGGNGINQVVATLIAYDLQAGTYTEFAKQESAFNLNWCEQMGSILAALLTDGGTLLEVGCGEATTLAGTLNSVRRSKKVKALGFDISWSRLAVGQKWLTGKQAEAELFVGDIFSIPLADNSIDVVYTSHSLEPNGGREVEAIRELMRVARKYVVLVEPIYELASDAAKLRMDEHGYVKDLRGAAQQCGATVSDCRLLEVSSNPLNPSGLLVLEKQAAKDSHSAALAWECPITRTPLSNRNDVFVSNDTGLIYPVVRGIPMLRPEHVIVASSCL